MANQTEQTALETVQKQPLEQESTRPGWVFRPDVDIVEQKEGFIVFADLPGVDESSVHINLEKGTLRLDAQLATLPGGDWSPLHAEYRFGGYHREFRISEDIDSAGVSARMKNGVLEVHLPKSEEHRPRAIPVQAA